MRLRRPGRHPEEQHIALGFDYYDKMEALGPRPREAVLTFHRRMAGLLAARQRWYELAETYTDLQEICTKQGIPRSQLKTYLAKDGLQIADLLKVIAENDGAENTNEDEDEDNEGRDPNGGEDAEIFQVMGGIVAEAHAQAAESVGRALVADDVSADPSNV